MTGPKLNELMNNLLKISQGDVDSLARANAEFAKSITGYTKLPAEHLEVKQFFVQEVETSSSDRSIYGHSANYEHSATPPGKTTSQG